jgi:hypothetical protein
MSSWKNKALGVASTILSPLDPLAERFGLKKPNVKPSAYTPSSSTPQIPPAGPNTQYQFGNSQGGKRRRTRRHRKTSRKGGRK